MSGMWNKTYNKISVWPIVLLVVTWELTLGVNYWSKWASDPKIVTFEVWNKGGHVNCFTKLHCWELKQTTTNKRKGAQDCLQIHQTAESRENHIQHALKLGQVWQSLVIMFKDSFQLNYMLSITISLGLGFKMAQSGTKSKNMLSNAKQWYRIFSSSWLMTQPYHFSFAFYVLSAQLCTAFWKVDSSLQALLLLLLLLHLLHQLDGLVMCVITTHPLAQMYHPVKHNLALLEHVWQQPWQCPVPASVPQPGPLL